MKRSVLFLVCFSMIAAVAWPQVFDTAIFTTDFEKMTFLRYLDHQEIKPLDLLSCPDHSEGIEKENEKKLGEITGRLNDKKIGKKKLKKQIREIYRLVQENYLKVYSEEASFNELLSSGKYNCVSGSALYALILDRFNIDYEIMSTPDHVYLIAGNGYDRFLIETTSPVDGVFYYNDRFKSDYIEYLVQIEFISEEDFVSRTIDDLFEEYYEADEVIDMVQLASLQYYNRGVTLYEKSEYKDAVASFEKAKLLYPGNPTNEYALSLSLGQLINQQSLKKQYSGKTFAKFLNMNPNELKIIQFGSEYFNSVTKELMISHPDPEAYQSFFNEFRSHISDSIGLDEYMQTYYVNLGYYEYSTGDYSKSLRTLNLAYLLNPENIRTKDMIHDVGIKTFVRDTRHQAVIDSLEYYFDIFPFLFDQGIYQRYYTYCHCIVISKYFDNKQPEKGLEYLEQLRNIFNEHPDIVFDKELVELLFIQIMGYYVHRLDYNNGIRYLETGLEILPHSTKLKERRDELVRLNNSDIKPINVSTSRPITTMKKPPNDEELFSDLFAKCWKTEAIIEGEDGYASPRYEYLTINAQPDKKAEFKIGGSEYSGRWAYRPNSRLMYLIPKRNENDYIVFKVTYIDFNRVVLRPYEDNKLQKFKIEMTECP